jgi:hsp70-interacting protein
MESLLRWGIENSGPNVSRPPPRTDLDTGIIDHILGKPDSVLMREALSVAVDEKLTEDERVTALHDLEMVSFTSKYDRAIQ